MSEKKIENFSINGHKVAVVKATELEVLDKLAQAKLAQVCNPHAISAVYYQKIEKYCAIITVKTKPYETVEVQYFRLYTSKGGVSDDCKSDSISEHADSETSG
nr:putative ORF1 [Marmot picobirnavirus]